MCGCVHIQVQVRTSYLSDVQVKFLFGGQNICTCLSACSALLPYFNSSTFSSHFIFDHPIIHPGTGHLVSSFAYSSTFYSPFLQPFCNFYASWGVTGKHSTPNKPTVIEHTLSTPCYQNSCTSSIQYFLHSCKAAYPQHLAKSTLASNKPRGSLNKSFPFSHLLALDSATITHTKHSIVWGMSIASISDSQFLHFNSKELVSSIRACTPIQQLDTKDSAL